MPGWDHIVQLDVSANFDRVSHSGFLLKLRAIDVGGSLLSFVPKPVKRPVVAD